MSLAGSTKTAPARPPDGFWTGHPRYRSYVLFAGTGIVLWLAALILLRGIAALGSGVAAWEAYLANLGSVVGVGMMLLVLIATLFFAVRWLRVGVKVQTVALGPLPALPAPFWFVVFYATFGGVTGLLLLIFGGVIL